MNLLSKAAKSTSVPAKYMCDGSGRDCFVSYPENQAPPQTMKTVKGSKSNKVAPVQFQPTPKFVPDGSGRDMFMQNDVMPKTGVQISGQIKTSPVRKVKSTGSLHAKPLPRYNSNGNGRDAYVVGRLTSPPKSIGFRFKSPTKKPCPRTDPPPKFHPSGQRDGFHSPFLYKGASKIKPKDEGFNYGSPHLSRSARYKHGKKGGYKRKSKLSTREQDAYVAQLAQQRIGNGRGFRR